VALCRDGGGYFFFSTGPHSSHKARGRTCRNGGGHWDGRYCMRARCVITEHLADRRKSSLNILCMMPSIRPHRSLPPPLFAVIAGRRQPPLGRDSLHPTPESPVRRSRLQVAHMRYALSHSAMQASASCELRGQTQPHNQELIIGGRAPRAMWYAAFAPERRAAIQAPACIQTGSPTPCLLLAPTGSPPGPPPPGGSDAGRCRRRNADRICRHAASPHAARCARAVLADLKQTPI
jgi:hypothetical protein